MLRRIVLYARATHPGPTLVVTLLALVLGVGAGEPGWHLGALVLAVFAGQLSIGFSNDAIDADRDVAAGRRDKPVARGDVSRRGVWIAAVATLAVALAVSFAIGLGFGLAHLVLLASGWAYNLGVKGTPFSPVPFAVAFGTLPSLVTLADEPAVLAAWWATTAGALLGVSVHVTNVLPDLDDDARTGVIGLPHRFGARAGTVVSAVCLAAAAGVIVVGTGFDPIGIGAAVGVVGLGGAATVLALRQAPSRWPFRLVMAAALLLALQLAAGGASLSG